MAELCKPSVASYRGLRFNSDRISSHLLSAKIIVPANVIQKIRKHLMALYSVHSKTLGLEHKNLPNEYIAVRYNDSIQKHTNNFSLKFLVLDFLEHELNERKISVAHRPRLEKILRQKNGSIEFRFRVSTITELKSDGWKKLSFTPPRRKLYKDLDRQAKTFLEQEAAKKLAPPENWTVQGEDWIGFDIILLGKTQKPIIKNHQNGLWMRISTKYLLCPFQNLFLDKKVGDSFLISNFPVEGFPEDAISSKGNFLATITSIVKGGYFSEPLFRSTFRLTTEKEVHEKLIEIFSFRNDISQRRSIIEEVFRLLFSKFRFEIPRHLILRRQETLLHSVRKLPDYHVYKSDSRFVKQLELLAEKQLKEEILIDRIAHDENIQLVSHDICEYLNLFSHERLQEFVYFRPDHDHLNKTTSPLRKGLLAKTARREKVLNHVIHALSQKTKTPQPQQNVESNLPSTPS
ncbi:hypothetical protein KAU11_03185 [Candidatus Babeliales bacterium]|nr:hypothetical protein [Candidatus Babeliales bacterium]